MSERICRPSKVRVGSKTGAHLTRVAPLASLACALDRASPATPGGERLRLFDGMVVRPHAGNRASMSVTAVAPPRDGVTRSLTPDYGLATSARRTRRPRAA